MFNFTHESLSAYINKKCEAKCLLNITQLNLLVESVTNIVSIIFEREWQNQLQNLITMLNILDSVNGATDESVKDKSTNQFMEIVNKYFGDEKPVEDRLYSLELLRILRFCIGPNWGPGSDLRLERVGGDLTSEQEKEIKSVIHDQIVVALKAAEDELRKRKAESLKTLALSELKEIKNNDKDVLIRDDLTCKS